jgi:hypothetical protein
LKDKILRVEVSCSNKDMVLMTLNSVIEPCLKTLRDAQLVKMLIKTTKLLPNAFETLRQIIDSMNENAFSIQNKNLLVIFFGKL